MIIFRLKLKHDINASQKQLSDAYAKNISGEVQANVTIQGLKAEVESKELEALKLKSEIDWANERISKLEVSLQSSIAELKIKSELAEKWEFKVGELQQSLVDHEK